MEFKSRITFHSLKQIVALIAFLLLLLSLSPSVGAIGLYFIVLLDDPSEAVLIGVIVLTLSLLLLGTGGALFWHTICSLQGKGSNKIPLPSVLNIAGGLSIYLFL
jgi:hypothetical protein